MTKIIKIGSTDWKPYEDQMKNWFASWSSFHQAQWILRHPKDYVSYNNVIKDDALQILDMEGFPFSAYQKYFA